MKKIFYLSLITINLISCNTERTSIPTSEVLKIQQVSKFQNALRSLGNIENRPTIDEIKNKRTIELSDRRKDLLIPTAIDLIKSFGLTEYEINQKTQGNRDKILSLAVKIYNSYKIDISNIDNY